MRNMLRSLSKIIKKKKQKKYVTCHFKLNYSVFSSFLFPSERKNKGNRKQKCFHEENTRTPIVDHSFSI